MVDFALTPEIKARIGPGFGSLVAAKMGQRDLFSAASCLSRWSSSTQGSWIGSPAGLQWRRPAGRVAWMSAVTAGQAESAAQLGWLRRSRAFGG